MGWAVEERGEYGLAEEPLRPGDQRAPRPELAVECLLHEHHYPHTEATSTHVLRREHPVVAGLGGLHTDVAARVQHLASGPASLVVELSLVREDGAQFLLHRHDLRLHELEHAGRRALYDVADVLWYTYLVGHTGHSLSGPRRAKTVYRSPSLKRSLSLDRGQRLPQVDIACVQRATHH